MRYAGWYARRRGILQHLDQGTISLLDSAVHDFLCLIADHKTGVAWASAEKIHALCPADISLRAIQRSLASMEKIGWLKRFRTHGKRGNYPIVVGKYFVSDSSLRWKAVNLERTTDWRSVQFYRVTDLSFVSEIRCQSSVSEVDTDLSPNQERRMKTQNGELDAGRPASDAEPPVAGESSKGNSNHSGQRKDSPARRKKFEERIAAKLRDPNGDDEPLSDLLHDGKPEWWAAAERCARYVGYSLDLQKATLGANFAGALAQAWDEHHDNLPTPGILATKVIDACNGQTPRVLYPPDFVERRDLLRYREKTVSHESSEVCPV